MRKKVRCIVCPGDEKTDEQGEDESEVEGKNVMFVLVKALLKF